MASSPGGKEVGRLNLKVLPDTTQFVPELKKFAIKVEKELKIEIPVTLDLGDAYEELQEFRTTAGAGKNVKVDLELDTAEAYSDLTAALATMQTIATVNPIEVEIDVDGQASAVAAAAATEALSQSMRQGASTSGQIGRNFALWGPLIVIAGVAIAGLVPALAALVPLMAGVAVTAGVIGLSIDALKKTFKPLKDEFKQLKKEVGGALTKGLDPFITRIGKVFIPLLSTGLQAFAGFMNGILKDLGKFLTSSLGIQLIAQFFVQLTAAIQPFGDLLVPAIKIFLRLVTAALPAFQMMGDALLDGAKGLNLFLARGKATDTITKSMGYLGETLKIIGKFIAEVFPALFDAMPALIAAFDAVADTLGAIIKAMRPVFSFMSKHKTTVGALAAALTVAAIGFGLVAAAMVVASAIMAVNPWALAVIGIAALAAGLIYAYKHSALFREVCAQLVVALGKVGEWAKKLRVIVIPLVAALVLLIAGFSLPVVAIVALVAAIITAYQQFETFRNIVNAILEVVKGIFVGAFNFIAGIVESFITQVRGIIMIFQGVFTGDWQLVWDGVKTVISGALLLIRTLLKAALNGFIGLVGGIGGRLLEVAKAAFFKLKDGAQAGWDHTKDYVKGLPGKIVTAIGDLGSSLLQAGKDMIQGLIDGIKSKAGEAKSAVKGVTKGAVDTALHVLRIKSPSRVFYEIGSYTIQGMTKGIESQAHGLDRAMKNVVGSASDVGAAVFDPGSIGNVSSKLAASVGTIVDNTTGPQPQQIYLNWETGRGVMTEISDQSLAQAEFLADQDQRMGVPA